MANELIERVLNGEAIKDVVASLTEAKNKFGIKYSSQSQLLMDVPKSSGLDNPTPGLEGMKGSFGKVVSGSFSGSFIARFSNESDLNKALDKLDSNRTVQRVYKYKGGPPKRKVTMFGVLYK